MSDGGFMLAIETSTRRGSVTLGRDAGSLRTIDLGVGRRHGVDLMPAIDRLCGEAGIGPGDLGGVAVSIGPGSFTGLRIGVTTAKVLSRYGGARLVGVCSLDVIAANVVCGGIGEMGRLGIALAAKKGLWFGSIHEWGEGGWRRVEGPVMATAEWVAERCGRGGRVVCDKPGEFGAADRVVMVDESAAIPTSWALWLLGRAKVERGETVDPLALEPLYVREPDAEEVWRARAGKRDGDC